MTSSIPRESPPGDPSRASRIDALVAAWCTRDRARAFLPVDLEVIDSTASMRALIIERLTGGGGANSRDLFNACGMLGRLIASRGGSPTLATLSIDGLREVVDMEDTSWLLSARAAVAEGFAEGRRDMANAEARARWEYPGCVVSLHEGIVAIAAGYPDDDEDALAAWASRVANAAVLAGARRVVISGAPAGRAALADALSIAGVELLAGYEALAPARRR